MIRRLAASFGLCSVMALTAGTATTVLWTNAIAEETDVSELLVEALGGASGLSATRREVGRGDTLLDMLVSAGSSMGEADRAVGAMSNYFSPQRLQVGQVMTAVFDTEAGADDAKLTAVSLSIDDGFVVASRTGDGSYIASLSDAPLEETLVAPLPQQSLVRGIPTISRLEVRRGDTLIRLVLRGGAQRSDAEAAIRALSEVFDPTALQVGQSLEMVLTPDIVAGHAVIASLSLSLKDGGFIVVERQSDGTFATREADQPVPTDATVAESQTEIGPFLEQLKNSGALIDHYRIASGDTLMDLMIESGATVTDADKASRALSAQYNERHLQIGQSLYVIRTGGPRGSGLHVLGLVILDAGEDGVIVASRSDDGGNFVGYASQDTVDLAMLATLMGEPQPDDLESATQFDHHLTVETLSLERGDTIMGLVLRAGAGRVEADRAIRAMRTLIDPYRLQIGQEVRVAFDMADSDEQQLVAISLKLDDNDFVQVDRNGDNFVGRRTTAALNPGIAAPLPPPSLASTAPTVDGDDATTDFDATEDTTELTAINPGDEVLVYTPHVPPVTETESLTVLSDDAAQYWFEIQDGDTLAGLLRILTQNGKEINAVVSAISANYDVGQLAEGQQMIAITDNDGGGAHIIAVSLDASSDETVVVVRQQGGGYDIRRASSHVDLADFQIASIDATQDVAVQDVDTPVDVTADDETEITETPAIPASTAAAIAAVWPDAPADLSVETAAFGSGDTLMDVLLDLGVDQTQAHKAVVALSDVYNPRHIRAGQDMDVLVYDGSLYGMMLRTAPGERIDVALADDGFTARVVEMPLTSSLRAAEGTITSSLYQAAIDAGVPPSVLAGHDPRLQL